MSKVQQGTKLHLNRELHRSFDLKSNSYRYRNNLAVLCTKQEWIQEFRKEEKLSAKST